jgi:pyrimidine 5'-nucleotidase
MVRYIIFDLDNTLYSSRYSLEENVLRRMGEFAGAFLGTSPEEAWRMRRERKDAYTSIVGWLRAEKGLTDVEAYLSAVYPENEAENLPVNPDPGLRAFLESIPVPKAVLTNSPRRHVDRIFGKLGFEDLFTHIFDIEQTNFKGKPDKEVYMRALARLGTEAGETLFIDDNPLYADSFCALGGRGLLLDENNRCGDYPGQRIQNLRELTRYLE